MQTSQYNITFSTVLFVIQDKLQPKMNGKGDLYGGLYILHEPGTRVTPKALPNEASIDSQSFPIEHFNSMYNKNSVARLWHPRLGHLTDKILKLVNNNLHLNCNFVSNHNCNVCPLSKF